MPSTGRKTDLVLEEHTRFSTLEIVLYFLARLRDAEDLAATEVDEGHDLRITGGSLADGATGPSGIS